MKKVTGYISSKPLGCFNFEFYVDDNTTYEEIEDQVNDMVEMSIEFDVEEGYEAVQETVYRKK